MPTMQIDNPSSRQYVADWVEFKLCVTGEDLSKSELSSFIEDSSGSEPTNEFIDDVWNELERRVLLYGDQPPFELSPRLVTPSITWEDCPEYLMCIILSIDGNSAEVAKTGKLFERLSCKAVRNYFGGDAVIYGFPQKQSVQDICTQMYERFGFNPSANFKDRGVDIICWKPFGDRRKSQLAAIIQCAAGHNWEKKLLSVPLDAWRQYISWSGSLPLKGFTTPIIIEDNEFHDVVTDAGLMFDRPRLYRNVHSIADTDLSLKTDLITWCQNRVSNFVSN